MNNLNQVYIRKGNLGDIPWMLEELEQLQLFFGSKKSLFHKGHAERRLEIFIERDLVLIAEKETHGQIGLLIGAITPHLFNPDIIVLAEMLWWVPPAYRKTRAGYLLLEEYVRWGKENVDWITFSLQHDTPVNESTLNRFGFRHVEEAYLIETGCDDGESG